MASRRRFDDSIIIEYYKTQWLDIHHSRSQDWELSRLILAGFLSVSGLRVFTDAVMLLLILSGSFVLLSILAIFITIRHKRLFAEKMIAIRKLESEMGLDRLELFKSAKGLRLFSTQNFLIVIYFVAATVFGAFFVLQLVP